MSSGDDLKSSAHVWGNGSHQNEAHTNVDDSPPAYEGTETDMIQRPDPPVQSARRPLPREAYNPIQAIVRWSRIPWGKYEVPGAVVSADRTTITTTYATFWTSQQALIRLLAEQADLPPIPTMRVVGHHMEGAPKIDFDLTLNLSTLLNLSRPPRWHIRPAQVVPLLGADGRSRVASFVAGNNHVQIEASARQFLKDKSDRKSFMIRRTVENLPTDVLEGLLRNLVASLHYRGKLTVSFPVQCGELIIQRKPGGAGATVGGWFMNVLGLSPDVKYETLERVWEIGSVVTPSEGEGTSEGSTDNQSDVDILIKEWWKAWAPVIRDAILLKHHGKIGIEDWIEGQMGWHPKAATQDWGIGYS